jgi:hypothetical protein
MHTKFLPRFTLFTILIFLASLLLSMQASADIYLSKELKKDLPMQQASNQFHCRDKIYGVVTGKWPANSEHLLEAYWTDPQGKQREHTRYKFIARNAETRTWAWLRLHPAEPDILERLLMQEDDSLREFNGRWKVVFFIDGKKTGKLTFQVTCG